MTKDIRWKHVVDSIKGLHEKTTKEPFDPTWVLCYNDNSRNISMIHNEAVLDDVLQTFEDFCKGCGFVFAGFAIVDEDGIPIHGLNSPARLEGDDEDKSSQ
jgi:hypothetical protein